LTLPMCLCICVCVSSCTQLNVPQVPQGLQSINRAQSHTTLDVQNEASLPSISPTIISTPLRFVGSHKRWFVYSCYCPFYKSVFAIKLTTTVESDNNTTHTANLSNVASSSRTCTSSRTLAHITDPNCKPQKCFSCMHMLFRHNRYIGSCNCIN
jgi:hypothetical protein